METDVNCPKGFVCSGVVAGIKAGGKKDMALFLSDRPAAVAGVFTTNQVCAAPVRLCREHLLDGVGRAIVMNSGIANACTGQAGMEAASKMAQELAQRMDTKTSEVFVCSTGRIGPQLPMEKIVSGLDLLLEQAAEDQVDAAAEAMMTTDTRPKICTEEFMLEGRKIRILGFAKGAGMIEPNMATMLSFILTDAAVDASAWQMALKKAVDQSFNRISVDGDQSTNDTVLGLANGAAENLLLKESAPGWEMFCAALEKVCFELAMMIVHDGEGADKFVTIRVQGARSDEEADWAARSVANSLLNKTAWAGAYPNWGRVMDALGYSRGYVEEEKVEICYDDFLAVQGGMRTEIAQEELIKVVSQTDFAINIDLHLGEGKAVVYTCNCTEEYVRINVE